MKEFDAEVRDLEEREKAEEIKTLLLKDIRQSRRLGSFVYTTRLRMVREILLTMKRYYKIGTDKDELSQDSSRLTSRFTRIVMFWKLLSQ